MSQFDIAAQFGKMDNYERVEILDTLIDNFVNGADSNDIAKLANLMTLHHRTLVQKKMELFLQFAKTLSEYKDADKYDARNAAACEISHKIMHTVTNGYARLPHI